MDQPRLNFYNFYKSFNFNKKRDLFVCFDNESIVYTDSDLIFNYIPSDSNFIINNKKKNFLIKKNQKINLIRIFNNRCLNNFFFF